MRLLEAREKVLGQSSRRLDILTRLGTAHEEDSLIGDGDVPRSLSQVTGPEIDSGFQARYQNPNTNPKTPPTYSNMKPVA